MAGGTPDCYCSPLGPDRAGGKSSQCSLAALWGQDVVPPGWDTLSCPQCHQPRQPPGENPGDVFLLSGWSRIRVELERHCGRRILPLPMTLAEPLLLTDQAGCPLTCMHSLGRSGMLHHQQSLVISLGWGQQPGLGTPVWDWDITIGWKSYLFPPACDTPSTLCCWQMGDSPPSPVWGIHLVAVRAGTASSVLPQPLCALCSGKNSSDREGAAGTTLPLNTALCVPGESPSHVTVLSWLGRIGPQALTKPRGLPAPGGLCREPGPAGAVNGTGGDKAGGSAWGN